MAFPSCPPTRPWRRAFWLAATSIAAASTLFGAEYFLGRSNFNPQIDNPLQPGRVYDGANADRVDDFLRRVPENSVIHVGNGVYETRGVWDNWLGNVTKGFRLKTGWTVTGSGTNSLNGTVFRLVDVPVDKSGLYNFNAVFSTGCIGLYGQTQKPRPNVSQVTIRDLQVDCNYPVLARTSGSPALQLAGIQMLGNRGLKIVNVLVRNAASLKLNAQGQPFECFQVYAYNPWATNAPGDYYLERVVVADYAGGYTSAICVNGNATGIVQNCVINLASDRSQRYGINFAAGVHHFTIRSNFVFNATRGINNDNAPVCQWVTISQNQFLDCATGMFLEDSQRCSISNNVIVLDGSGTGIALQYHPTMPNPKSGGCLVVSNRLIGSRGEGISLCYQNEWNANDRALCWSSQNVIQHNVFSPGLESKIPPDFLASNTVRPGNRRADVEYPACGVPGAAANAAAIGFPSDIGPGTGCNYCPAKARDSSYGFIARVSLVGTRLDLRPDGGNRSGYSDFTTGYDLGRGIAQYRQTYDAAYADVQRGRSYRLNVYGANVMTPATTFVRVFVDWDHDGQFISSGEALPLTGTGAVRSGVLSVAANAPLGSTRMRIVLNSNRAPGPCDYNSFSGDVEDYTLTVLP